MAQFWNTKYHEDTTEKRVLTMDDLQFLSALQREMNTQDHMGEAAPRYWVVRDYNRVYGKGLNNPDGVSITCNGEEHCMDYSLFSFDRGERIAGKIKELYPDEISEEEMDDLSYMDFNEIEEFMADKGFEISICEYETIPVYSNFFLTHKAAEEHLRSNDYHYDDSASPYAMTAWRNPEVERLYDILEHVDLDALAEALHLDDM